MDNDYKERLRKALNGFSDNDLYEIIKCLPDEDKSDNLIAVQECISKLEEAVCIAISELEGDTMNWIRVIVSLASLGLLAIALITARRIYWEHKVSKKTAGIFLLSSTGCIALLLVLFLFL